MDPLGKCSILPGFNEHSARYGKPDLFITFTCNPLWTEITSSLLINQKASDRPHLVVRVFRMKLRELLSDILKIHIFGRPLAHVCTI